MEPDLLVLHEAPDHPELRLPGRSVLRERIEMGPPGLVAFGHCYWKRPLATLANGSQVLNVDSRVVVLRGAER